MNESMLIPTDFLRQLRGETSEPLISELARLLDQGASENRKFIAVQIKSDLVVRGLSLVVRISDEPAAWIYLSRKEIPGYIPIRCLRELHADSWFISNDEHGEEFAVTWKRFSNLDKTLLTKSIARALEALGAPQKHTWELSLSSPLPRRDEK